MTPPLTLVTEQPYGSEVNLILRLILRRLLLRVRRPTPATLVGLAGRPRLPVAKNEIPPKALPVTRVTSNFVI